MKFTKRQNNLIRYKGKIVSAGAKAEIVQAKKFNPEFTYKELTAEYFKVNKKEAARYSEPLRDEAGQIISNAARAEIQKASKELGIPFEQAKGIFLEGKLIRSELGRAMLHTASDSVASYKDRAKDYTVKIKLPGEKRYRVFKDIDRALKLIEKQKAKIFKSLRKKFGKLDSDKLPSIPMVEKYKPGEFLPKSSLIDFNKVMLMNELDDDEYEQVKENLQDSNFSNTNPKNESKNNRGNRRSKNKRVSPKAKAK